MSKIVLNKLVNTVLAMKQPFRAENIQIMVEMKGQSIELSEIRAYLKGLVSNHILTIEDNYYKLDSKILVA